MSNLKELFHQDSTSFLQFRENSKDYSENLVMPFDTTKLLRKWDLDQFSSSDLTEKVSFDYEALIDYDSKYIVIENGFISKQNVVELGIELYTLEDIKKNIELIKSFDQSFVQNKLIGLNEVFKNSALLVKLGKNKNIEEHINIYVFSSDSNFVHTTYYDMGQSSSIKVLEYVRNHNNLVSYTAKFRLDNNANLNYVAFDQFQEDTKVFVSRYAKVYQDATLDLYNAVVSETNLMMDNKVELRGTNAQSNLKTIAVGNGTTKYLINSNVEHNEKHTTGFILNQGIVSDKAHITFNGIGKIVKGMKQSNATQTSKGIVLSNEARLDANPFLLIDEYDVTASHGATIGKVDEDQLYYLMSRGLTKKEAEKLIVMGFLTPLLKDLNNKILEERLLDIINKKIAK